MTQPSKYTCPACKGALSMMIDSERVVPMYSLWCPHGGCDSIAANLGAEDVDLDGAYAILKTNVAVEQGLA